MLSAIIVSAVLAFQNPPEWDRGLRLVKEKNYTEALAVFDPLCRSGALSSPNEALCWGNVAECHLHLGNWDKAIAFSSKAIAGGIGSAGYTRLGAAYLKKRLYVEALNAFKKAPSSTRTFYGATPDVNACLLKNDQAACARTCQTANPNNILLRDYACDTGLKGFEQRCRKENDISACDARCKLKVNVTGSNMFRGTYVASGRVLACSTKTSLTIRRSQQRATACTAGDVEQCELSCSDDNRFSSCRKRDELRAQERASRLQTCRDRDEVTCVASCEVDKDQGACAILETLRLNRVSKWKTDCGAGDSEACHDLGTAYAEGRQAREVDPTMAAKWFLDGCRLGRATSCAAARKHADAPMLIELDGRDCAAGDDNACRAEAVSLIAAGRQTEGVAKLQKRCATDPASCTALGDAVQDADASVAKRAHERGCESGASRSCRALFDAWYDGTWLEQDRGDADDLYEERCVDLDDDAPRIDSCSQMRARIRGADRSVPGEEGPSALQFDGSIAAVVGADLNPYRTNNATTGSAETEILGFGIDPHLVFALQPQGRVTFALGPVSLRAGGRVDARFFAGLPNDASVVAHASNLNFLSGAAEVFAGAGVALGVIRLRVDDVASVQLAGGRLFSTPAGDNIRHDGAIHRTPPPLIPYGGAIYGDMTLREQNVLRASATVDASFLMLRATYQFHLARISGVSGIDGVDDATALFGTDRLLGPGTLGQSAGASRGTFDEHRHRGGIHAGANLLDIIELPVEVFGELDVGYETYLRGNIVPGTAVLGFRWGFEDGIWIGASGGVATMDLQAAAFTTWVADAYVDLVANDDEVFAARLGVARQLVGHPVLSYVTVNMAQVQLLAGFDGINIEANASGGVVDWGAPTLGQAAAPAAQDFVLYGTASSFVDVPVGFGRLSARIGAEVEFLDPTTTAQSSDLDVLPGASLGYGRIAVFAGVRY